MYASGWISVAGACSNLPLHEESGHIKKCQVTLYASVKNISEISKLFEVSLFESPLRSISYANAVLMILNKL